MILAPVVSNVVIGLYNMADKSLYRFFVLLVKDGVSTTLSFLKIIRR